MFVEVLAFQGLFLLCFAEPPAEPQVATSRGIVQGWLEDHSETSGARFRAFVGIPYADQPTRFQLAKPKTPWSGTLQALKDGPACPQPTKLPSSEDCLYLNVFTPQEATSISKFPVMVFLHGSAFTSSSSYSLKYSPDFLIPKGVILVTLNYRLGSLGFLTLGSTVAPGNLGLHDSLLALQWVQEEISQFGGDPAQVTLFGQSAGAAMTMFHYLSPISAGKGLFRGAIAQSGSALAPWAHYSRTEGTRRARVLAKSVGCVADPATDLQVLQCLQSEDLETLMNHTYIPIDDLVTGYFPFVPVLDDAWSDSPFFGDSLQNLMENAAKRAIPLMTGFNTEDGIVAIDQAERWKKAESELNSFILTVAKGNMGEEMRDYYIQDIRNHYFSSPSDNKISDLISLFTDTFFAFPAIREAIYFSWFTYGYIFAYNGTWKIRNAYFSQFNISGVAHGAELPYLFKWRDQFSLTKSEENTPNLKVKDFMVEMWTNFAKTSVPSSDWKTVSHGEYRLITSDPSNLPMNKVKDKFYNFWQDIFYLQNPIQCFQKEVLV